MEFPQLRRFQTPLVFIVLFFSAWIPRAAALDVFATPDEHLWLARSANFYQAIADGQYENTFQREHPGVTVMWAGTLGFLQGLPEYAERATGQLDWRNSQNNELSEWLEDNSRVRPLELLAAGRWWIVLAISLLIATSFFPLRQLFGPLIAALAVLYFAWDPFYVALSRLLHLDGLLTALAILTLLTFLDWLYVRPRWVILVISGALLGLTGLTKTPALFVAVAAGLLFLAEWLRRRRSDEPMPLSMPLGFLAWGAIALITFVSLWPAMWVDPLGVMERIIDQMTRYVEGHKNFFMGQLTLNPGLLFYPVAWLFRTTPATVIGLVAAGVLMWQRRWPMDLSLRRRGAKALLVYALVFIAMMSIGDKMFDRYILPVFPALDTIAILGWLGLAAWLLFRLTGRRQGTEVDLAAHRNGLVAAIALAGLILLHGIFTLVHFPYYFTYYNPLLGGSRTAPDVMMVGWGEGLNEAAEWINQQAGSEQTRVISGYGDTSMSYFLHGPRLIRPYGLPDFWFSADYAVHYVNQWQRQLPSEQVAAFLSTLEPVHVVRSHGLELARVYDMRKAPVPEFLTYDPKSGAIFDDRIILRGHRLEKPVMMSGDTQQVTLVIDPIGVLLEDLDTLVQVEGPDGTVLWHSRSRPANAGAGTAPLRRRIEHVVELVVPDDASPGQFAVTLAFEDPLTGQSLPLNRGHGEAIGDEGHHAVAWIQVQRPETYQLDARWEQVQLNSLRHQPDLRPGETLLAELSATGQVDGSLQVSVRLVDSEGRIESLHDQPLTASMDFPLSLPVDAEPGVYTVAVVVYDRETLAPHPDLTGRLSTPLTTVLVHPDS
ncbi:MAG: glycosyltransferase family 39 protein [Chloroflexota bacterium]|nr:glycosyltransferase family 39 protein [Chloroflexota bacterium]